ncbi:MAG: Spy/CpxP family protein refolding chaperone [Candidatus Atribacteria bacterium]|nr:Spy/CpxP family protein refolding chaperone [Candidatus Atribacteria bacterium]
MKKLGILVLLVISLVGGLSAFAFAAGPYRGGSKMPSQPSMGMRWNQPDDSFPGRGPLFGITLTTEQKEKVLEIQKKNLEIIQNLRNQIQSARLTLQELSLKPTSPETAEQIRAKVKEIMDLRKQIQDVHRTMYQEFLDLLTPEQLTQLVQKEGQGPYGKGFCGVGPGLMRFGKRW